MSLFGNRSCGLLPADVLRGLYIGWKPGGRLCTKCIVWFEPLLLLTCSFFRRKWLLLRWKEVNEEDQPLIRHVVYLGFDPSRDASKRFRGLIARYGLAFPQQTQHHYCTWRRQIQQQASVFLFFSPFCPVCEHILLTVRENCPKNF